jgi:HD-GYP domain
MLQTDIDKMLLTIVASRTSADWVIIDNEHRILFANSSLLQSLHKRREEVIGCILPDTSLLAPVIETMETGEEFREQTTSLYSQIDRANIWYRVDTYLFTGETDRQRYALGNFVIIDRFKAIEDSLTGINLKLVKAFVRAISTRDAYTAHHAENVAALMVGLADYMRFAAEETALAYLVGLVHDIGKVGIPEAVLTKPGRLTAEECELIKRHPIIGAEILREIEGFGTIAEVARHHHERWDGQGYPDKLARDNIPVLSRMLAICDAYDAMVNVRCYRNSLAARQTLAEIERCAGSQFDPIIGKCFIDYVYHRKAAPLTMEPLDSAG